MSSAVPLFGLAVLAGDASMGCGPPVNEFNAEAPAGDQMQKIELPTAKCLDGTPAVYYIAANTSSSKFVVWLQGGGSCQAYSDCVARSLTQLGSSKDYASTRTASYRGMLTSDKTLNPDFAEWNRIYVPYCTGDVHAGQGTQPTNPFLDQSLPNPAPLDSKWTGYFNGHLVVKEALDAVKASNGGEGATEVILTGCSAGGIGTFLNCDYTAEQFPKARVACRPEGGWFGLPIADEKDWKEGKVSADMHHLNTTKWAKNIDVYSKNMPAVQACMEATKNGSTIPYCDTMPSIEGWSNGEACCGSIPYFYPYMKTPTFISQNTMDAYQIIAQGGGGALNYGYTKYLQGILAGSLVDIVVNGAKKDQNGLFASACFQHCPIPWSGNGAPKVDGKDDMQRFGDWYFGRVPKDKNMNLDNSTDPTHYLKCAVRM